MNKRKKSGSIAIPFLLTFLISLIIIGGIAMVIYDNIDSDNSSLETMTRESELSENDSHTVMLVLDLSNSTAVQEAVDEEGSDDEYSDEEYSEEESEGDEYASEDELTDESSEEEETYDWEENGEEDENAAEIKPYTFILMRSIPVSKQIVFIGLPENMTAGEKNLSLTKLYTTGGGAELKSAVEYTLEVPVDRYMALKSGSFQKLCNILGGVNFAVPGDIKGFKKTDGMQYLSPEQIEKIISYGGYGGGEIQRVSTAASLISSMVNQTSGARIADNLDNTFETLANTTDTDISALDYQQKKYALKFLLKNSDPIDDEKYSDRSLFLTPSGTQTSEAFILDTTFIDSISKYFKATVQETTRQDTTLQPMMPETGGTDNAG